MFPKISVASVVALFYLIAAVSASPIFFGHPKQTNIFITSRMDTVGQTVNQIPIMVKTSSITPQQNPSQTLQLTPVATQNIQALPQPIPQSQQQTAAQTISKPQPVQPGQTIQPGQSVTLKVPVPVSVANHGLVSNSPADMNKFFNEMKNSKKPYLTIKMKSPKKSMLSEALDLFTNNESEHIVVHVPYNVHTHNIHHHHIQPIPVYKHVTHVKHVPVHVQVPLVKEVAIPVHLPAYRDWNTQGAQWW